MAKTFEDILKNLSDEQIELSKKRSMSWYLAQIKDVEDSAAELKSPYKSTDVEQSVLHKQYSFMDTPGRMLFFRYDAKTKATLPYWDMYPLILPISAANGPSSITILGLNFHYLPPYERARFFTALSNIRSDLNTSDDESRIRVAYKQLKNAARYRAFRPALKRYLLPHVRTRISIIKPSDWDKILMMPLARFQKKSEYVVWSDSIKSITRR